MSFLSHKVAKKNTLNSHTQFLPELLARDCLVSFIFFSEMRIARGEIKIKDLNWKTRFHDCRSSYRVISSLSKYSLSRQIIMQGIVRDEITDNDDTRLQARGP